MSGYLVRRALQAIAVLAAMSLLVHVLLTLMPGDPVDLMASGDPRMTAADLQRLRELHGVDRPVLERYAAWALPRCRAISAGRAASAGPSSR